MKLVELTTVQYPYRGSKINKNPIFSAFHRLRLLIYPHRKRIPGYMNL